MNQGKLEVVKQEMARVNIDILGINGLEWANLIQMTITFTTVSNPFRRNGVAIIINKESVMQLLLRSRFSHVQLCGTP